jgi:hypothetical protein
MSACVVGSTLLGVAHCLIYIHILYTWRLGFGPADYLSFIDRTYFGFILCDLVCSVQHDATGCMGGASIFSLGEGGGGTQRNGEKGIPRFCVQRRKMFLTN